MAKAWLFVMGTLTRPLWGIPQPEVVDLDRKNTVYQEPLFFKPSPDRYGLYLHELKPLDTTHAS
jgi:hypothetical protein